MNSALRKISTLCTKDFVDLAKNPTMIVGCLLPIGFVWLYGFMYGDLRADVVATGGVEAGNEFAFVLLSMALSLTIGMVGSMTIVSSVAEEKEKHTLRTLMLSNVSASQILMAKGLVGVVVIALVETVCFFLVKPETSLFPGYLAIGIVGALPIVLISLVLGLSARDQMTASLYSTPVVLAAFIPLFGTWFVGEGSEQLLLLAPTGGMNELLHLLIEGNLFGADALLPAASMLVWMVGGVIAFAVLYKRLAYDN